MLRVATKQRKTPSAHDLFTYILSPPPPRPVPFPLPPPPTVPVPVFGYRLLEEGFEQVTLLGNQFKDDVKAAVEEKKKEEEALKKKEEEEKLKKQAEEKEKEKVEPDENKRELVAENKLRIAESKEPEETAKIRMENDDADVVNGNGDAAVNSAEVEGEQPTFPPIELV